MKNRIVFIISCLFFLHTCIINEDLPPNPNADFEPNITAVQRAWKVNFRNTSLHASSYKWNFGDTDNPDNTSTEVTPTFTYTKEGIYTVILTAQGFGSDTISKQVQIGDNSHPTDILLDNNDEDTVLEKEPIGTLVGILTTIDPNAGDSHAYSLVTGPGDDNNDSFTISGNQLKTAEIFDYSVKSSYSIRVRSDDGNGGSIEKIFTIFIKERTSIIGNWVQATAKAGWTGRREHAVVVYDNKMWVLGGFNVSDRNDVWWSTDGINWTEATASANWAPRKAHTAVNFNGKMWVLGGDGTWKFQDVWWSTDGINWTEAISTAPWTGRDDHAALVHNNKMWILGGRTQNGSHGENDIWSSNDGITWSRITPASAVWGTRFEHSAVVHDNKMYVAGGFGDPGTHRNDIWSSNDGITWTENTNSAAWSVRESHEMVSYHNKIWIFGGANNRELRDMWNSTDGTNWTEVKPTVIWSPRQDYASLVYKDRIWVLGGGDDGATLRLNDVWYYQE